MTTSQPDPPETPDWRHHARCRDQDPELFFPIGEGHLAQQQIREAKDVCLCCDVTELCLEWALDTGQQHGIWGNTTEDERKTIRRRRARTRARTETTVSP